ncbi:hypothetical protein F4820DRAFT_430629 [Hypoxylon rubiginosum]|uniref:Uncharacterized protein n=1 Tax=Hypoxylon rubiginosum TaxID=110542 RepID=A0ACB9YSR7_9PEZI|nr:hypothetical protein F4820DRAFT_430629 [Hypoxylon rubiginosum]
MVSITFSIRLAFFCHVPISTKLLATGKVMSPVPHMTSCSSIRELPFLWFIFHYKLSLYPVMDRQSQMSVGDNSALPHTGSQTSQALLSTQRLQEYTTRVTEGEAPITTLLQQSQSTQSSQAARQAKIQREVNHAMAKYHQSPA